VGDNYTSVAEGLGLDRSQLATLAANSIESSFLDETRKAQLRSELAVSARDEGELAG
jgi:adenosine deaminase